MAGVGPEWSHNMAHALTLDPRTWARDDVSGLGLIDEDVDLLRGGVCDIPAQGLIGLIRILKPTSCNFFSGTPSLKTPKLSVLGLERWVTDRKVLPGCT
jgi:hypothetical protein